MDPRYVNMTINMYTNIPRYTKIGDTYGTGFATTNGLGAGDSFSLLVALAFVSVQFRHVQHHHTHLRMGSCVDDRNLRGTLLDVLEAIKLIMVFDDCAGQTTNPEKLVFTATTAALRKQLKTINIGDTDKPIFPRVELYDKLVGAYFNVTRRPNTAKADQRSEERRVGKECRSRWSPYH